jgi:hypothetical protein
MRHVVVLVALACCAKSPPPSDHPRFDDRAAPTREATTHPVLRPKFVVEGTVIRAGTAFVLQLPDQPPLLVTAFHLFGTGGGFGRDLTWDQIPRLVTKATATSVEDETVTVVAGPPLAIEGAVGMSRTRVGGDVAALPIIDGSRAGALVAASDTPAVGERVTLLAAVIGKPGFRHGATVIEVTDEAIAYKFDEAIELRATSGAAVVDGREHVIAINLGGRHDGSVGIGNPVTSFVPAIRRALR